MMKKFLLMLVVVATMLTSCDWFKKKKNDPLPAVPPGEKSEIPEALKGKWMYGNFSMTEFWNQGTYLGNAFETSVCFNFIPGGNYEFYLAASSTYYYCTTQAYTFKKGTVKFNDDHSFIVYPTEGRFRGYYSCTSGSNFDRAARPDELPADTLYWSFENDSYGKEHLVIRNNIGDYPSYFRPVEW